MIAFAFTALALTLFAALIALAYVHLKRENERQWKRYARSAMRQTKALRAEMQQQFIEAHQQIAAIPVFVPKNSNVAGLKGVGTFKNTEDRYEELFSKKVEVGGETIQVPRAG